MSGSSGTRELVVPTERTLKPCHALAALSNTLAQYRGSCLHNDSPDVQRRRRAGSQSDAPMGARLPISERRLVVGPSPLHAHRVWVFGGSAVAVLAVGVVEQLLDRGTALRPPRLLRLGAARAHGLPANRPRSRTSSPRRLDHLGGPLDARPVLLVAADAEGHGVAVAVARASWRQDGGRCTRFSCVRGGT